MRRIPLHPVKFETLEIVVLGVSVTAFLIGVYYLLFRQLVSEFFTWIVFGLALVLSLFILEDRVASVLVLGLTSCYYIMGVFFPFVQPVNNALLAVIGCHSYLNSPFFYMGVSIGVGLLGILDAFYNYWWKFIVFVTAGVILSVLDTVLLASEFLSSLVYFTMYFAVYVSVSMLTFLLYGQVATLLKTWREKKGWKKIP